MQVAGPSWAQQRGDLQQPMSPMYPEEYDRWSTFSQSPSPSPLVTDSLGQEIEYAAHAAHAAAVSQQQQQQQHAGTGESKRDKRRREMVDRVQRLHEDTVARRDR